MQILANSENYQTNVLTQINSFDLHKNCMYNLYVKLCIITFILLLKDSWPRKVKYLIQGHSAGTW
jgi:hypothetical protein